MFGDLFKSATENENTISGQPKRYLAGNSGGTRVERVQRQQRFQRESRYGFNQDLQTSDGLYNLANQAGLKEKADEVVAANQGEDINKIYSGGWISDIMDTLNITSYGMVGLLKGQSFMDGVNNRESFSDKDSLGQYGLGGVVAGLALDIVVDPLTWIAPWTLLKKVPGIIRVADKVTDVVAGRNVITEIAETGVSVSERKGGLLSPLFEKTVWMAGADPIFRETYEKGMMYHAGAVTKITNEVLRPLRELNPNAMKELFTRDETGRIFRRSNDELSRVLDKDTFAKVAKANDAIDQWGQKLVDVGLLSKDKFDEGLGEYVKQTYREIELAKTKGFFGFAKNRITAQKSRVEGMTPEQAKKLDLIDDPAVVYSTTLLKMVNDYHNAKLFKDLVPFASSKEVAGFVKLADTPRFNFNVGYESAIKTEIASLNKTINTLEKEINKSLDVDADTISELHKLKSELKKAEGLRADSLTKFFEGDRPVDKVVIKGRQLGIIPERLQPLANRLKKFDTYEEALQSRIGIKLQVYYEEGILQRNGFDSSNAMKQFFERAKNPYKAASSKEVEGVIDEVDLKEFEAKWGFAEPVDDAINVSKRKLTEPEPKSAVGATTKTGILENISPKSRKVVSNELALLKKKIADYNAGFKSGVKITKKEIEHAQSELIKIISKNFKVSDRGKYLTKIKNTTSLDKIDDIVKDLMDDFNSLAQAKIDKKLDLYLEKAVQLGKSIEKIKAKLGPKIDIDLRSVQDSLRNIEKNLSDSRLDKEVQQDMLMLSKEGALAGKWVPTHIADMIDEKINPSEPFGSTVVAAFKYGNVVMSPAAFVRNAISNKILNWWKLGIGPWRADLDIKAYKAMNNLDNKYWKMASELGMGEDTYFSSEIWNLIKGQKTSFFTGSGKKYIEKGVRKIGDWYQAEETHAKMVAFIKHIDDGFSPEEAMKAAHSATFNYAQVTPFIRKVRQSLFGVPFITFAMKAAPVSIETMAKHPGRVSVFGKIKNASYNAAGVSEEEVQKEMENAPPWIKDGFYTRLWDDEQGRAMYFDWTYIIPFGAIIDGSLIRQDMEQETGLPESPAVKIASNLPAVQLIGEIFRNETFSGKKIWRESDDDATKMKDLTRHIIRMFSPPPAKNFIGEGYDKRTGEPVESSFAKAGTATQDNIRRNVYQEMAKNFGFKVQPLEADVTDAYREWNTKTGLQTLLQEQAGLQMFNIPYIPK